VLFVPRIRAWVTAVTEIGVTLTQSEALQNLTQAIKILIQSGNEDDRRFIETTAMSRLADDLAALFAKAWLAALLNLKAVAGVEILEKGLEKSAESKFGDRVQLFATLFNRDNGGIGVNLRGPGFSPPLLLRLLRLAYRHVRLEDDEHHEGSYSPGTRDHAERGRNEVLSALLATTGSEGWAAKLEMAADPLFEHIRDRVIALAGQRAAEEADDRILTEDQFALLDKTGEFPPSTREAMFALMRDRLDDINDLLLQEVSPRQLWATITDERVMRRELARVLRDAGHGSYIIDQEAVTADEKETDIRLRSTGSKQQGIIELKLGDERSGTDLFNTLRGQCRATIKVRQQRQSG
jgi:hypothetical protein